MNLPRRVFDAEERLVSKGPGGAILHASIIELGQANNSGTPCV